MSRQLGISTSSKRVWHAGHDMAPVHEPDFVLGEETSAGWTKPQNKAQIDLLFAYVTSAYGRGSRMSAAELTWILTTLAVGLGIRALDVDQLDAFGYVMSSIMTVH